MNDVVNLRPAELQPDGEVVADLRRLLGDAESGRLRGFALVALQTEQEIHWLVSGAEANCSYLRLHGLLAFVQRRLLEKWENR